MASLQPSWLSSVSTIKNKNDSSAKQKLKLSSLKLSFFLNATSNNDEASEQPTSENSPEPEASLDPVKLAFEKAKAYRKLKESNSDSKYEQNPDKDAARAAVEKAKECKKNKDTVSFQNGTNSGEGRGNVPSKVGGKKEGLKISSIDFMGLNFADKKEGKGLPAGLVPVTDPFAGGDTPEVEIIVGDTSKFGESTVLKPEPKQGENLEFYKPKVSTWGVFPRPGNISKTFGGGRTIRPGDVLETAEARAAKEERTRQLLAAYKKSVGLNVDPKLKSECEKALKDGDSLMDSGKLKEALPFYEKVMNKTVFKSELHGLAALQWSICQDSLRRPKEARIMYEKLQSHPNALVSKRARQFMFSFQAMEMMKVRSSSDKNTDYRNFFEAFVEDKTNYPLQEAGSEEGALTQALPYMIFLASPIFVILLIAVQRGSINF